MKRIVWIAIVIFTTLIWTLIGLSVFAQDTPPAGTKQATTAQKFIYKSGDGDTVRTFDRIGASGLPADYYENATMKQLRDSLNKKQALFMPSVDDFGAIGDGITDDLPAFQAAQSTGGSFQLTAGKNYYLSGAVHLSAYQHVYGNGSTIKINNTVGIYPGSFSNLTKIRFLGSGKTSGHTDEIAIKIQKKEGVVIDNCVIDSIGGFGIYADSTVNLPGSGNINYRGNILNTVVINRSRTGIHIGKRGEYFNLLSGTVSECDSAIVIFGGNNSVNGGNNMFNTVGLFIGNDQANNAHSVINGATFNHNTYNLVTKDVTSSYKIVGSSFQVGKLLFKNSSTIELDDCIIQGIVPVSIDSMILNDGSKVRISHSVFLRPTSYSEINGGTHVFNENNLSYSVATTPTRYTADSLLYTLPNPQFNPNLSLGSVTNTTLQISNSQGDDVTLPSATASLAGLMPAASFAKLGSTTLSGYGITDAYTKSQTDAGFVKVGETGGGYAPASTGADLNSITSNQVLYASTSNPNTPPGSFTGMIQSYGRTGLYSSQLAISNSPDNASFRSQNNGTWSNWYQIASREWVSTAYAPLTGAGASGTWGIGITGNAATATKLATARTINGVSFDGSANITVADATKEPSFSKNTAFNKNFGTASGTVAQGNDSRINNGQTAYGWGDHASAGYSTASNSQTFTNKTWHGVAIGDSYIASASTWNAKQAALVSGTNIKTVNGQSVLGSGNIAITEPEATGGTYTPTVTSTSNLDYASVGTTTYTVVNGIVTVYGAVTVSATGTGTCYVKLHLPSTYSIGSDSDVNGIGHSLNGVMPFVIAHGDSSTSSATLTFSATIAGQASVIKYSYQYAYSSF